MHSFNLAVFLDLLVEIEAIMLEHRVNVYCDTYHPNYFDSLIDSLGSYINSKLDYERRTPEFITEVRRRLYFIHEYNCQVAEHTLMYPRSRKLDQLLVKYVELEFEVLYLNNEHPPKEVEVITELRVLRLLQVMLYKTVLKNESLINENTNALLKKTVLKILGQVKSTYLAENKLDFDSASGEIHHAAFNSQDVHRNAATSDYGTDDDSDFENDNKNPVTYNNGHQTDKEKSTLISTSDCMEVPLRVNGATPLPTIDFIDDDNYMVYLQKKFSEKSISVNSSENSLIQNCENSKDSLAEKKNTSSCKNIEQDNSGTTCIVVDSDEETPELDTINHNANSKKKRANEKGKTKCEKPQNQQRGVVTFEIIDDDDDESGSNYMVYLQKEVETNRRPRKRRLKPSEENVKEIVISDSEDEVGVEILENNESVLVVENENDLEKLIPQRNNQIIEKEQVTGNVAETSNLKTAESGNERSETSSADFLSSILDDKANEEQNVNLILPSSQQNINITTFENEIELNICENPKTNFLIDPAVVFENIPPSPLSEIADLKSKNQEIEDTFVESNIDEFGNERANMLGGPVLGEKMDDLDCTDNLLECRLNDSLLEEILLNDSYLLESEKEFEDLECFLFDDKEEQFDIPNFSVETEDVFQTEFINKNMKSLEALLNETKMLMEEDNNNVLDKNKGNKSCHGLFKKNRRRRRVVKADHRKRCSRNTSKYNPLKDFTNNNSHQLEEDILNEYCELVLEEQTHCRRKRENGFKTSCKVKNAVNNR